LELWASQGGNARVLIQRLSRATERVLAGFDTEDWRSAGSYPLAGSD